jgi:hypothetical protein
MACTRTETPLRGCLGTKWSCTEVKLGAKVHSVRHAARKAAQLTYAIAARFKRPEKARKTFPFVHLTFKHKSKAIDADLN